MDRANSGVHTTTIRDVEVLNSRLMSLEKAFVNPRGLPGRPGHRHVVFAPSEHNSYAGMTFAGVYDSLENFLLARNTGKIEGAKYWLKQIRLSISVIQYSLESAILILE